jgi:hypothetical protein
MDGAETSKTFPAVVPNNLQWCGSCTEQFQESGLTDGNRDVLLTTLEALISVQQIVSTEIMDFYFHVGG